MQTAETYPLLPNEPRQLDWHKESQLTQQFLTPVIAELGNFLLQLRVELDATLSAMQPFKAGKPYPLGQCLEISLAMKSKLQEILASELQGEASIAFSAIQQFAIHGGAIRQIWGDLRGEYFQNAFLFGDLYVDVSNDTVVPTKPKVEILPFSEANLTAIRDFHHFGNLVQRYWKAEAFPNFLFPDLAPYAPVLIRYADGSVQLHDASDYMITLATSKAFVPSETYLSAASISADLFEDLVQLFQGSEFISTTEAASGRIEAIEYCQRYRTEKRHMAIENSIVMVKRIIAINAYIDAHQSL